MNTLHLTAAAQISITRIHEHCHYIRKPETDDRKDVESFFEMILKRVMKRRRVEGK